MSYGDDSFVAAVNDGIHFHHLLHRQPSHQLDQFHFWLSYVSEVLVQEHHQHLVSVKKTLQKQGGARRYCIQSIQLSTKHCVCGSEDYSVPDIESWNECVFV